MWFYFSFARDGWLGSCLVEAPTLSLAVTKTHILGINPGGEILATPVPDEGMALVAEDKRHILITDREEIGNLFGEGDGYSMVKR